MSYFLILKNGAPEKLVSDLDHEALKEESPSFWILTHQILNIYDDEALAKLCMETMKDAQPELELKIVELHQIDSIEDWN